MMGETVGLSYLNFSTVLTEGLWSQFRQRKYTDLVFNCNGIEVPVHRVIVSAVAPSVIELCQGSTCQIDIDAKIFNYLMEYIYRGRTSVKKDQLDDVRLGAEKIRLYALVESINHYMKLYSNIANVKETLVTNKENRSGELDKASSDNDSDQETQNAEDSVWSSDDSISEIDLAADDDDDDETRKTPLTNPLKKLFKIKCDQCDYESTRKDSYLRHLQVEHCIATKTVQYPLNFTCTDCGFVCSVRKVLLEHRQTEHGKKKTKTFQCSQCEFVSDKHMLLSRHIQNMHSTDRPFSCKNCDYRARNSSDLSKHSRYHRQEKFECTICGRFLVTKTCLHKHLKLHATPITAREKPHICQFCPYKAARKGLLVTHLKRAHDYELPKDSPIRSESVDPLRENDSLKCQHCEYKTTNRFLFINHMAMKHELDKDGNRLEPKFQCGTCDFKGMTSLQLLNHIRNKHTEKTFRCQMCDFTAVNNTLLTYHERKKHSLHKPFACETCGIRFITSGMLRRHAMIHSGDKFVCSICGNSFSLKIYLRKHIRIMHDPDGPRFMCHMCAFKTKTKDCLQQHIKRMHSENEANSNPRKGRKK